MTPEERRLARNASSKAAKAKKLATPEGRAKACAASYASIAKRRKTDTWFLLRGQLATATYQLLKQLAKGKGTDYKCQKLFGESRDTCYERINAQLISKGLSWEDHGFTWTLDHRVPIALAQTDVELYQLFRLSNCQVLTTEEHLTKSILDTATLHGATRKDEQK